MDRLNSGSYALHYRNLDSAEVYARKAYELSADYGDGRAEALNNMAFVSIARMEYDKAAQFLLEVKEFTDNSVELMIASVQQMRLCQRMSRNREFYDYRERAATLLRRINEERGQLDARLARRLVYAESEFHIVASTYYYYVGLGQKSRMALGNIDVEGDIRKDTAQYLNFLYNVGSGGIVVAPTQDEVSRMEMDALLECFQTARQRNYPYFEANALEAMAEHLLDEQEGERLLAVYGPTLSLVAPSVTSAEMLAGWMADASLAVFERYGDVYQTAGAHRTLASCFTSINDYESALSHLEEALSDTVINRAPDLVASIREQLSVAYSAIDDKVASDYNRNIYLDLQEQTRQDRSLEARADMLGRESLQLNVMIASVVIAILLLVFLLCLFSHLYRKQRRENNVDSLLLPLQQWQESNQRLAEEMRNKREEVAERFAISEDRRAEQQRRNADNRAKVALAVSVIPLIDRMQNEVRMLAERDEEEAVKTERYKYIAELTDKINQYNDVLASWIQLRQGLLNLKIETFELMPLLDIVAKGRAAFRMKGVELVVESTQARVKADRVLTLFMINTLADNARKFTDEGGCVTISAKETGNDVEVSVTDTGKGLSEEEQANVFSRNVTGGHGFGLMNCRGIIEKYRKTSRLFASSTLGVESEEGRGSRFFFRLPCGVARLVVALLTTAFSLSVMAEDSLLHLSDLSQASAFADSAYFSNIAGTYARTLQFSDSCRKYLNLHYLRTHPQSKTLMLRKGNAAFLPPEVKWFHDSVETNYQVILDIRNESAVAALALHEWAVYEYNNKVYTRLFKELSADNTLAEYCRVMQQSQANKTVAVCLCVLVLLMIIPAYYMLYYRHRLNYRFCVERIDNINALLLQDIAPEEKLRCIEPCLAEDYPEKLKAVVERIVVALREAVDERRHQTIDLELAEDELRRSEHEGNGLYVCNAVLDNCLSALKHETMYYPNRIRQLVESGRHSPEDLRETVAYYRDLCSLLAKQAKRQIDSVPVRMSLLPVGDVVPGAESDALIIGNRDLLRYLLDVLRRQDKNMVVTMCEHADRGYVVLEVTLHIGNKEGNIFSPSVDNIPYIVCSQIVREHSEATDRRGCGLVAETNDGQTKIRITLPRKA